MKILITTQAVDIDDPILGFFHGWLNEFAKHFERIDVICLREGKHDLPNNVHVHSLGKENGENRFLYVWRFYKYVWQFFLIQHVDFVFFHMGAIYNVLAAPFFLIRKFKRTKFYWWKTHGKVRQIKEHLALHFCDNVYTAGSKSFDISSPKIKIVGHAIDTDLFTYKPKIDSVNKKTRIIFVGRVVPIKKIETALDVIAGYSKNHEVQFDIVGPVDNNQYKQLLDGKIEKDKISNVVFTGPQTQTNLVSLYHNADLLLHPAYEAGFDKVILEAMAAGVIPITSIPSFSPVLMPYGLYVEAGDVSRYVSEIEHIMNMTEGERSLLQVTLRDIVLKEHSISTLSKRIFGV